MKKFIVAVFVLSILSLNIDANAAGRAASSKSSAKAYTGKTYVPKAAKVAKAERAEPGFFSSAFGTGNTKAYSSHSAFGASSKPAAKASGPARSAWAK